MPKISGLSVVSNGLGAKIEAGLLAVICLISFCAGAAELAFNSSSILISLLPTKPKDSQRIMATGCMLPLRLLDV